ncbi:MAG TPA: class I adenylate-forming enzyme family protein [Acidimicrobiales bacterium]
MSTLEGPPLSEAAGVGSLTLGGFLEEVAGRFRDNEALVFEDPLLGGSTVRWTYGDLLLQARRVASALIASGVRPGTPVGILMGTRPEAVSAFFGVALAGGVAVLLSTFSSQAELEFLLDHSGVEVVLTQQQLLGRNFVEEIEPVRPQRVRDVAAVGTTEWEKFLERGAGEVGPQVSPDDPGTIIYSSGTTDRPKGVLHRQGAPSLQFWLQGQVFGRTEQTRMWTALPMFWTAGLNTAMGATLATGGCWVMQETFQPAEALGLLEREKVTEPYTLPHQTAAMAELPDWERADLSSLKFVYGKSAFARHPSVNGDPGWNMPVAYGLSETCAIFATHYFNTPRQLLKESTGRLLPGNRLRVIDPDTGRVLGSGESGELAICGPTLMDRYVGMTPEECFDSDGFFRTGDAGWFDDDGYLHWTGRRSEMIKTAGANVSPAEIEVALRAFQPIKLARVLGRPDERLGEVVVLCVVLRDGAIATADDVRVFLRERLAAYKVPKEILFMSDGEVPMTSSDTKVRDDALRKLVEERLRERRASETGVRN